MNTVRISVQIPFCFYQCAFCPYGSIPGQPQAVRSAYMRALVREIVAGAADFEGQVVDSVHLTGGLIAAVEGQELDAVLTAIRSAYTLAPDAQIVLNSYPGMVNVPTVRGCQKHGVTAVDVELFTINAQERAAAGLEGGVEDMDLTQYVLFSTGYSGLAITLLYGMEKQTELMMRKTLGRAVAYAPRYISVLPCGDASPVTDKGGDYAALAEEYLTQQGYTRYAPGRYAKGALPLRCYMPEMENIDYVGFGLGARSRIDGIRCRNTLVLSEYIAHPDEPEIIAHLEP